MKPLDLIRYGCVDVEEWCEAKEKYKYTDKQWFEMIIKATINSLAKKDSK